LRLVGTILRLELDIVADKTGNAIQKYTGIGVALPCRYSASLRNFT
jgi:hypothetical protein